MCARRKQKYEWDARSIKALREFMGLTQQALADELGMRQQTISEWETGMYRPRRSTSKYLSLIADRVGFEYVAEGVNEYEPEEAAETESAEEAT
jgi:DNA-binding transcriptional regulator YiaG